MTTQGDAIVRADWLRQSFGVTGPGCSVGVISNGVVGLADAQAAGELPDVDIQTCVPPPNFFQDNDPTQSPAGAEGTAMLEIVHDIAPGATLLFGYPGDPPYQSGMAFNAAMDCLAAHADVVVDDFGFYNAGPLRRHELRINQHINST